MRIHFIKKSGVTIAIAKDENGNEIDRVTAFSKPKAKRLLEEKLGLKEKKPEKAKYTKSNKPNGKSHSLMTGLIHVTEAKNWKKSNNTKNILINPSSVSDSEYPKICTLSFGARIFCLRGQVAE